ncbi:MAG: hypothetical protein H6819_08485 [Phycisphaerales bacterium]|nr:hypothetical protein [Phycisphaerales bacterium]MCB9854157.1 hypothetical protein [Phycisphaerales bacterium]MCB9864707.1 hypothetical protein [Phycisphaerales bacterium]
MLAIFGAGSLGIALVAWGLLRTPGWYAPASVPQERLERQSIRDRLVEAEQAFTHELLHGEPFKYHIYEKYVNEWLAMRYDLYPRIDEVVAPIARDPFVSIGDGRVRLAAKYNVANREAIVSADFSPTFENGEILLRFDGLHCGSMPLPNVLRAFDLDRSVDLDRNDAWPGSPTIAGSLLEGIRVGSHGWWQNGGVDYEVTNVQVGDGVLTLDVTPLARQARRSRH